MNNYIIMQTTKQTREQTTYVTNNSQAVESNHSPLFWRGAGGEAVGAVKSNHSPLSWRGAGGEASIRSMTRKELAQLAGVSERTLRRWLHSNHNQLIAAGYQASQRKLPPRVVKYLMEFYGIER